MFNSVLYIQTNRVSSIFFKYIKVIFYNYVLSKSYHFLNKPHMTKITSVRNYLHQIESIIALSIFGTINFLKIR